MIFFLSSEICELRLRKVKSPFLGLKVIKWPKLQSQVGYLDGGITNLCSPVSDGHFLFSVSDLSSFQSPSIFSQTPPPISPPLNKVFVS